MRRFLPVLFWAALAATFLVAVSPNPPEAAQVSDKIQHLAAFAALTALGTAAYPRTRWLLLGGGLAVFGGLIELAQMIPGLNRQAELLDWLADAAGIVVAFTILALLRGLRR